MKNTSDSAFINMGLMLILSTIVPEQHVAAGILFAVAGFIWGIVAMIRWH